MMAMTLMKVPVIYFIFFIRLMIINLHAVEAARIAYRMTVLNVM